MPTSKHNLGIRVQYIYWPILVQLRWCKYNMDGCNYTVGAIKWVKLRCNCVAAITCVQLSGRNYVGAIA